MEIAPTMLTGGRPAYAEWSTQGRYGRQKVDFWNNLTSEVFTPLSIDPENCDGFEARLAKVGAGDSGIAKIWSEGSTVRHSRHHVALSRDKPCFLLHLQVSGSSINEQAGKAVDLRPGDCAIVDSSRPYSLVFGPNTRFIVWRMAAAKLRTFIPEPENIVSSRISGDLPPTRILRRLLEAFCQECQGNDATDWVGEADSVLLPMLALASQSIQSDRGIRDFGHALLTRAAEVVDTSLSDARFGVPALAATLGVSERYVQRVFGSRGLTPGQFIAERRIERAARLMKNSSMTITQIAFEAGFDDLTQFGRSFRRVMGMTATQFRRDGVSLPQFSSDIFSVRPC